MNVGIVLAGGIGSRFGSTIPKQYQTINGHEVLYYAIDALKKSKTIEEIIVVAQEAFFDVIKEKYRVTTVKGGKTRNESLYNALKYVNEHIACENVIILEAARPMITSEIVDSYINDLKDNDAVITGQKIVASLGCYNAHTVSRDDYYLIEAPEAFKFKLLYDNFDKDSKITATNQQLPDGSKFKINFEFTNNLKITYYHDLKYCELLMETKNEI